ncbi:hypothetical protein COHA_008336 [Chlorella ohadii]|uniref:Uncharacterized protein n=1 Tax=Chlorella ohadii TaxID=2649997 RepID=A0AAD5DKD6_9CHLO|nr:hypothetical protein COHA_008336 [Chlorella ohadii]
MRRRPGIAGIKATQAERGQFRAVGEAVAETQAAVMRGQMTEFKDRLEEFALRHKADIRGNPEFRRAGLICCVFLYGCICCKWWFTIEAPGPRRDQARNPEFRAQFHAMCAHIGVDPLASNKGTWNKLLGFGGKRRCPLPNFYYELGVQVIEACITSRPFTGGLLELSLGLGSGFGVVKIGSRQFVRSMPTELSTDSNTLIELAQRLGGYFALADAVASTGWQEERVREAVTLMAREGLVLIDDQPGADGPISAAGSGAPMPLAAGSRPRPPRLFWVPAVGVVPAIEAYRQEFGLASTPLVPTVDITAIVLTGSGEEQPPGQPRGEDLAAAAADALQGLDVRGSGAAEGRR